MTEVVSNNGELFEKLRLRVIFYTVGSTRHIPPLTNPSGVGRRYIG